MTDLQLLLKFLGRQKGKSVRSGDWEKLKPEIISDGFRGKTIVKLSSVEIGFSFDIRGNFEGIFNYKE